MILIYFQSNTRTPTDFIVQHTQTASYSAANYPQRVVTITCQQEINSPKTS